MLIKITVYLKSISLKRLLNYRHLFVLLRMNKVVVSPSSRKKKKENVGIFCSVLRRVVVLGTLSIMAAIHSNTYN